MRDEHANFVYLENLTVASRQFLSRTIAALAVTGLFPLFAHAGVIVVNGTDLARSTPGNVASGVAFAPLEGDDAAWLSLPVAQADGQVLRAVEAPAATELNTPAIAATAIGLIILATRRKKKTDDGRQSLWGALGNAPPVAGM